MGKGIKFHGKRVDVVWQKCRWYFIEQNVYGENGMFHNTRDNQESVLLFNVF